MRKHVWAEARTDKSRYSVGEPVKISITLMNKGRDAIELTFTSAQRYDFIIMGKGKEVWRWSSGKAFAMVLESLHLTAGEKQTYTETWKPKNAASGKYEVTGIITSKPAHTALCKFTINNVLDLERR